MQKIVKMENRAWKGIRLVTESINLYADYNDKIPIAEQQKIPLGTHLNHVYEITRHIPINHFMLEMEYEITEMFVSSVKVDFQVYTKGSYCKLVGFSKTIAPLIAWIEKTENVKIEVTDPNLSENEKYDIEENEKTLKKIPGELR